MAGPGGSTALRPPTGMRGLPGTAMRMGTAMRPGSRAGVGGLGPLNTNIAVADRPVTQQGMMGMKIRAQGPGRQVADKSYYMGELRKKVEEMQTEIDRMNSESEQFNKDNAMYQQMERKYETLIKEVRKLQGDLADYNLIVDKSRNNTDPQDINNAYANLKSRNETERRQVDDVFTERKEREEQTKNIEQQAQQYKREADEKLNSLTTQQRQQYAQLEDDYQRMMGDIEQKQMRYNQICKLLGDEEAMLRETPQKERINRLHEQRTQLEARVRELEEQVDQPVKSFDEQREELLDQVKNDNKETATIERNIAEVEQRLRAAQQELEDLESGKNGAESEDAKKYAKLQEKEKEMDEFVAGFDDNYDREVELVSEAEWRVQKLLEHLSKGIGREQLLPSKEGFQDLQSEVSQKQRGLENSLSTAERLKQEKQMRDMELEKINNLDAKIAAELQTLSEKRSQMTEELPKFSNIEQLKKDAETTRERLNKRKQRLDVHRKVLKQQVLVLGKDFDDVKAQLAASESAGTLEALEGKLRFYEQNIFHLKDFIEAKEAETDYGMVYDTVSQQVAELNRMLQQAYNQPFL